ncbi:FUSC family protein [Streptomyces sp. NPDC055214]
MAVQSLKAAGAALIAWAVAGWWWDAPMALMAPWTALFLVQNTIYRSLRSGVQQFTVVIAGTLIAAGAGALLDNTMLAMAVALPLTVLLGNYARFGTQGVYAPTAALFVLGYGSYSGVEIGHRLLETLLGAVIGIGVNALVLPPVHQRSVQHLRGRLPRDCAELLDDAARGVRETYDKARADAWYSRAQSLTDMVTDLRTARRWSDESYRFNPFRRMRRAVPQVHSSEWDFAWDRLTEHVRITMRTLSEDARDLSERPRLPADVPEILSSFLAAAADVCACDDRGSSALDAAREAHGRLTSLLADTTHEEATPVLGGVVADTQRLLHDLETVTGPLEARAR